jgi:hypothetical protein
MIVAVEVGVSLGRPPRHDATVYVLVEADTVTEGSLVACQIATCHPAVAMPVSSRVVSAVE